MTRRHITTTTVARMVCRAFQVEYGDLCRFRGGNYTAAKEAISVLSRELTHATWWEIARTIGVRSHSSVVDAWRRGTARTDDAFLSRLQAAREAIAAERSAA